MGAGIGQATATLQSERLSARGLQSEKQRPTKAHLQTCASSVSRSWHGEKRDTVASLRRRVFVDAPGFARIRLACASGAPLATSGRRGASSCRVNSFAPHGNMSPYWAPLGATALHGVRARMTILAGTSRAVLWRSLINCLGPNCATATLSASRLLWRSKLRSCASLWRLALAGPVMRAMISRRCDGGLDTLVGVETATALKGDSLRRTPGEKENRRLS